MGDGRNTGKTERRIAGYRGMFDDIARMTSVVALMAGWMDGWREKRCPRHMFRESGKRCGVERCQMVYITAGVWQGERKGLQNNNRERKETGERQISVTKPDYSSQGNFLLQDFSLETID